MGIKGSARYIAEHLSADYDFQYVYECFKTETRHAYGESIPLKPHVRKTLVTLYERGYCLNVLTASPKELTELCLKRLGVFGLFENVWSIDDFSLTKADARLYEEAVKRLGVPLRECVMVDDNLNVNKIAKQVGMRTVGVYDESTKELQDEMQSEADVYVRDFAELLARID